MKRPINLDVCCPPGVAEPQYPTNPPPVFELVKSAAQRFPDKAAINFYGFEFTYRQLEDESDRFAAVLVNLGLKKGDRVAILLENCPQYVISFLGVLKMGGIVTTVNPMYKPYEVEHQLKDSAARAIILEDQLYGPIFAPIRSSVPVEFVISTCFGDYLSEEPVIPVHPSMTLPRVEVPDSIDFKTIINSTPPIQAYAQLDMKNDTAMLQYTSGTTGTAKGAMLSHYNIASHPQLATPYFQMTDTDISCVPLPLFHVTALFHACMGVLYSGGTVCLMARFDMVPMLQMLGKFKVTYWVTTYTLNIGCLNFPNIGQFDYSGLRMVGTGGAPVPEAVHRQWSALTGCHLLEGYGLSESSGGIFGGNTHAYKGGSIGSPYYHCELKLMDVEQDPPQEVWDVDAEGELWLKGPTIMQGYWNDPDGTKEALVEYEGVTWLRTGDIGRIDAEGWIYITGRIKDMLKVSGHSVFLQEIDAVLIGHPGVQDAACIGITHEYRGEVPKAFVILKEDAKGKTTAEDIILFCKEKLAEYKVPTQVQFIDELPKNFSGKVLRRILKEQHQ